MTACPRIEDAASWALGALPDDEAAGYAVHLRSCGVCAAEVARLQPVADVLPMAAEQHDPPAELRGRIMDVVREEAARAGAPAPAPAARRRRLLGRRPAWVAAATAVCLAVGIGVGVAVDGGDGGARTVAGAVTQDGASARLEIHDGEGTLRVSGMQAPPAGHVYQVWVAGADGVARPTDALFSVRHDGSATVGIPGGVGGVDQVMVTTEPDGGSAKPSGSAVVVVSAV